MKISYRREIRHNYMIVDLEELPQNGFESRMLAENAVEGVLRFQIRQMDGGVCYYYEITSRQPLSRLLENRNIRADEIRKLIIGIFGILGRMEAYLLREETVLLDPEYVYVEPDSFRVWLCLVPGLQRDFTEDFGRLLEYLLGCVNHQDKESVVLAYGLYQETRKENYGMDDIMRILQQDKEETLFGKMKEAGTDITPAKNREEEMRPERIKPEGAEIEKEKMRNKKDSGAGENEKKRERKKEKMGWPARLKSWIMRRFWGQTGEDPIRVPWEMMFQEENEDRTETEMSRSCTGSAGKIWFPEPVKTVQKRKEADSPGTVLLTDLSERSDQRVLRALDPGEEDIIIAYYPFIIGKQENLVDYRLDHDTVSRLHLRIDREGDTYCVQDLNSTNGTMLCGRILENNEITEIHTGDEICIARYRYRFE